MKALFMNTGTLARSLVCTGKKSGSNLAGRLLLCFKISAARLTFSQTTDQTAHYSKASMLPSPLLHS